MKRPDKFDWFDCNLWLKKAQKMGLVAIVFSKCCSKCHYFKHQGTMSRVLGDKHHTVCCGVGKICLKSSVTSPPTLGYTSFVSPKLTSTGYNNAWGESLKKLYAEPESIPGISKDKCKHNKNFCYACYKRAKGMPKKCVCTETVMCAYHETKKKKYEVDKTELTKIVNMKTCMCGTDVTCEYNHWKYKEEKW